MYILIFNSFKTLPAPQTTTFTYHKTGNMLYYEPFN
jgi:hypothetical protein